MILRDIRIILHQVSESGNVGAICRAMKNMGLYELRLSAPLPLDIEKIKIRAVNAWDIWENARFFDNLADATADCSIIAGTTRRRGQNRKNVSMSPRDLAAWLLQYQKSGDFSGGAAIVFGNERTGLEEAELNLCNFASHIPVSEACPSLNLSHAVQLYAYELFLAMEQQRPVKGEWTPMNQTEILGLVDSITNNLANIGFYKNPGREDQERFLRDIISRAGLSISEGNYFKEIVSKAAQLGSKS
ncbi:MAG: RNA methyltransferase [Treponema sp.]|nr:RNA methyltransferase [Treponema sp.]